MMGEDYRNMIVITNRELVKGDYLEQIRKVLRLSPKALILREKDLDDAAYGKLAEQVMLLCEEAQVPCFLHSRIQLAERMGSRCIHLPFSLFMEAVRQGADHCQQSNRDSSQSTLMMKADIRLSQAEPAPLHQSFDRISVSCHSLAEAKAAEEAGADQIVLGTIFETLCKPGLEGRGTGFVREVCEEVSIPVFAIGGVTMENQPVLKEAGAAGGCMMSGFMRL